LASLMAMSGDQAVTVANGTYAAGAISTASHASTGGTYGGWLVLVAATPGSVIVDMAPPAGWTSSDTNTYDLDLSGTTKRVLFVGFKFINGKVYIGCDRIRFWHCEFTFPASTWNAENGHSNTSGGFYHSYHQEARTIQLKSGNSNIGVYGGNVHGTGTGLYCESGGAATLTVAGTEFYDLTDGGVSVDPLDNVHPDGMALFGRQTLSTVSDTYIHPDNGGTAGIGTEAYVASASVINMTNVWITAAGNAGMVTGDSGVGDSTSGTWTNVHMWGNGTGHPGEVNASFWNFIEYDAGVDNGLYNINSHHHFTPTTSCNTGVTQTGTDPATAWKASNTVTDWPTYFSGLWT
jgi:hypothetical protein